jgi:tetratricopeptide (TPR) repeat protein
MQLNPENGYLLSLLIADNLLLDRLEDAKAAYQQGRAHKLENAFPDSVMYVLAFAEDDAAGMQKYFDAAMGKPQFEDILLTMRSDIEAYYGRLAKAREFSRRAEESARTNGSKETAALWQAYAALHEAEVGNAALASEQAKAALNVSPGRDVRVLAGMALATAGYAAEASKLAAPGSGRASAKPTRQPDRTDIAWFGIAGILEPRNGTLADILPASIVISPSWPTERTSRSHTDAIHSTSPYDFGHCLNIFSTAFSTFF